jgi:hypothetical protein
LLDLIHGLIFKFAATCFVVARGWNVCWVLMTLLLERLLQSAYC